MVFGFKAMLGTRKQRKSSKGLRLLLLVIFGHCRSWASQSSRLGSRGFDLGERLAKSSCASRDFALTGFQFHYHNASEIDGENKVGLLLYIFYISALLCFHLGYKANSKSNNSTADLLLHAFVT
ncbi:uncharacterized protein LOC111401882 isoform X2 [Olea europaea var. sylvestris]|uniref:uncharacterized protein LOC111401882 isoform X2 n=1 Tax=Olea europaea var. sylvestris TaxID=158386 RepID=UPI000C1D3F56|nr:uncharacterized protein LOC111401882 isoform X2 [Olea europaea var. sylvestris]